MKKYLFSLALLVVPMIGPARADSAVDPTLPASGFSSDRYTGLWTKSPFAVATPDDATSTTGDYQLVGLARFDGVSYASLIDKSNGEHFVLASDKPVRNLTLVSVSRDSTGVGSIVMEHNGEILSLRQEQTASPPLADSASPGLARPMPQFALPANPSVGGVIPRSYMLPRRARDHRPPIVVPPQPPPSQ